MTAYNRDLWQQLRTRRWSGRFAEVLAPGGTLPPVGFRTIDPTTGKPVPASGQMEISLGIVIRLLDRECPQEG